MPSIASFSNACDTCTSELLRAKKTRMLAQTGFVTLAHN